MRAFWLLVFVPLAIAGYLAVRVSADGAELRRHQLQGLLDGRLDDVRSRASQSIAKLERQLADELANAPTAPEDLRALERKIPLARQVFRLDRDGGLAFPTPRDASSEELGFLERTASIWAGRAILSGGRPPDARKGGVKGAPGIGDSLIDLAGIAEHGWQTWYWAEGLHLLFWRRAPDGGVIGVEVERIGLLARVVGALPTTGLEDGRIELADSRGDTVTQWGPMLPVDGATATPDSTLAMEPPLDSWQLRYFMSPAQRDALTAGPGLALFLGLGGIALGMLVLAVYVYREYTRRLRDAARRVGFVTRVSHELRTPLTNIRMYAELLEEHGDDDEDQARRARVIVSESERLGRLIDNVLDFARHQRGKLAARPDHVEIDEAVREAVKKLEPVLAARSIDVRFELAGEGRRVAGGDALDQIVTNLMSNVEKYAPGGEVTVSTHAVNGHVVVAVSDRGPGVPAGERIAIFEPFHRAGDSLTEASGTGIGLAIARELARAAGGDLALADSASGARFELTLPVAKDPP
ncbi:MAG: HAMP domain-containing sensor histidine kinase [Kofleriaceae bacterium]